MDSKNPNEPTGQNQNNENKQKIDNHDILMPGDIKEEDESKEESKDEEVN